MVGLYEVCNLPDETYGDIVCDFTKCSNKDIKSVFQYLLTQEKIVHFSLHSSISTSFHGSFSSSKSTISKIIHIFCDANDLYKKLPTSNKWIVHWCVSAYFNCDGDHGLNHNKAHSHQTGIAQNLAMYLE